jgi:glycerophosphoryl diester phosphodiesterase
VGRLPLALLLFGTACAPLGRAPAPAARPRTTVWAFDDPAQPLAARSGPAILRYRDAAGTGWGPAQTRFAKASELGLPPLPEGDAAVMVLPPRTPAQGWTIEHRAPPNGVFAGSGMVSNYTLGFDVLWPADPRPSYRTFFQTDPANQDHGELFVKDAKDGGIGVGGRYNGSLTDGRWHRVVVAVQCALGIGGTGQLHKFIDGVFVGGARTPGEGPRCRWALGPEFHLFTDDDGEPSRGYVSSLYFSDRFMSPEEIAALGGPSARGFPEPGPAAPPPPERASRRVRVIGHRGGNSCCAPEDTLAAIRQALALGVDAIEIDIRVSADGVAYLLHDDDLARTTGRRGEGWTMRYSEIRRLDAGSWLRPEYAGEPVPRLSEALALMKGRAKVYLDIKSRYALDAVGRELRKAGYGPGDVIFSQNETYRDAAELAKVMPGAEILYADVPAKFDPASLEALKKTGTTGFDVDEFLLTPEFVAAAHAAGMSVSVYTLLDPEAMRAWIDKGVDGIETDFPAVLRSLLPAR